MITVSQGCDVMKKVEADQLCPIARGEPEESSLQVCCERQLILGKSTATPMLMAISRECDLF